MNVRSALVGFLGWLLAVSAYSAPIQSIGFETGDGFECNNGFFSGTAGASDLAARSGGYGLRVNGTFSGSCSLRGFNASGALTTFNVANLYVRMYIKMGSFPTTDDMAVALIGNGSFSDKARVKVAPGGALKFCDQADSCSATSSTTMATNTWYRLEFRVSTGSGTQPYEVKLDGTTILSGNANQTSENAAYITIGRLSNSDSINLNLDDIQLNDSTYPGTGVIKPMLVDSNGSTQTWTGSFTSVDEVPTDGDTTYVASTTSGAALFGFQSTTAAGISGTVISVKAYTNFREGTDGAATTVVRVRSGSTNSDSGNNNVGTDYVARWRYLLSDPADSSAWTLTDLDGVEAGLNEGTASQVNRLTTVTMLVETQEAVPTPTPTPVPTNTPTPGPTGSRRSRALTGFGR